VAEPQQIGEKKHWVLVKRPLREQLQELAGDHLGLVELGKSLTPQQRKALNNLKAACVRLNTERLLLFSPHTAGAREALAAVLVIYPRNGGCPRSVDPSHRSRGAAPRQMHGRG